MPPKHAHYRPLDSIIGRGILTTEALLADLRAKLSRRIASYATSSRDPFVYASIEELVNDYEPLIAENLFSTDVAAWIQSLREVTGKLPSWAFKQFSDRKGLGGFSLPPPPPPPSGILASFGDGAPREPLIRFPAIENAIASLIRKNIVTRDVFDSMADRERRNAFTVAREMRTEAIGRIRDALARTMEQGPSLEGFREQIKGELEKSFIGPGHVENVYRTNAQNAFSEGHWEIASDPIVSEIFPYREYISIHDTRARHEHNELERLGLSGTNVYRADDPFWDYFMPPWDFQCLLPGTILQGQIDAVCRSFYSGQAVEIVTRSGKRLRVTVNHPILTDKGFVAAKFLTQGVNVVGYRGPYNARSGPDNSVLGAGISHATYDPGLFTPNVDKKYCPTAIADVFSSLSMKRKLFRLNVSPNDLHGEAASCNGNVDIVWADWELGGKFNASIEKLCRDFIFSATSSFADFNQASLSNFGESITARRSSSFSYPSVSTLSDYRAATLLESRPLKKLCLGSASDLNASRYKIVSQDSPVDSMFVRHLFDRSAGSVFLDEIVKISQFDFSGHVYDAQSSGGWIVGDGIIISNCRCGTNLLTIEDAAERGAVEARKWLRTNVKPPLDSRLPHIPFRPPAGFVRGRRVAA